MNIFYTRAFDALPLTFARSASIRSEFARIQAGFDIVNPYALELVDARLGQASLAANLARYVSVFTPNSGHIDAGGYLVRNAGAPTLSGDLVNKFYADGLAFAAALPGQAGAAGKDITTNGATASWGLSVASAISLMNSGCI